MASDLATVRLSQNLTGLGVTFPAGTDVPCLPSSQVALVKNREGGIYHVLSGLFVASNSKDSGSGGPARAGEWLAAAGFPLRACGGSLPKTRTFLRLGNMYLALVQGSIADCCTEVIVNAANEGLWMGGGVAGALRSRGGIELEQEARRSAPTPQGEIVRTSAGRLKAREIYHAVVIDQHHMTRTEISSVESSFRKVLQTALEEGVSSVAVPFLGCGVGGLDVRDVMQTYTAVARSVAAASKRGLLVVFVALDDEDVVKASEALNEAEDPKAEERLAEEYLKEVERTLLKGDSGPRSGATGQKNGFH